MTPLVLVILAVMWVLVLVPPLLRSRTDGRPNHSISSFQRQLRTLQRTGRSPRHGTVTYLRSQPAGRRGPAGSSLGRYADDDEYGYGYDDEYDRYPTQAPRHAPQPAYRAPVGRSRGYAAVQREAMRRRRMNVLLLLAGGTAFTGILAFGMGMTGLRWVAVACGVALVLYVVLLVQMRRAAELRSYRSGWSRMAA